MNNEKDLIWLPKQLAQKIKDVEDVKKLEAEIISYCQEVEQSLKTDVECMDDTIIQFKANLIKAKTEFKKAKDEELDAMYKLWEDYDVELSKTRKQVETAKASLEPLKKELQEVKALIQGFDTWGMKDLFETVKNFTDLWGRNKEVFEFLMKNYQK